MKQKKVRATSRGRVVWLSESTARNAAFLKKYNITVDDPSFQPILPIEIPVEVPQFIEAPELFDSPPALEESVEADLVEETPKKTRKSKTEENGD
jgi:hypothetical protein